MGRRAPLRLTFGKESWSLKRPFHFAGWRIASSDVVVVLLERAGLVGRGEATGVIYRGETPDTICAAIASVRGAVTGGITRSDLHNLLPPGGARNALDCALWDLECKEAGTSVWQRLGIEPAPVLTVATVGLDPVKDAAAQARMLCDYPLLKVKVDTDAPLARVAAIRAARPDARLVVDANQSWDFACLQRWADGMRELGVEMIEQPLAAGADHALRDYTGPLPLCADESCFVADDIADLAGRYAVINIKLDKCGGLTEALAMIEAARHFGIELMVGNMIGTSLSMAPSHVVAQFCRWVDLDGPLALTEDRPDGLAYRNGFVSVPASTLWG